MDAKNDETIPTGFPWTEVFVEMAMRALMSVHQDYLLWSTNQNIRQQADFTRLNRGPGVAYAGEVTVCAAISQQFIHSRYASGVYFNADVGRSVEAGYRYFSIGRELPYPAEKGEKAKAVDLVCCRINDADGTRIEPATWIEAKRAFLWSSKLDGTPDGNPTPLTGKVRDDIDKLREQAPGNVHRYVLVWNVADDAFPDTKVTPAEFIEMVAKPGLTLRESRMLPLTDNAYKSSDASFKERTATRWLWVLMAEVSAS